MAKQLKGSNIDIVNINRILYGHGDPDAPNLIPNQMSEMWKKVWPRLKQKIGKIIITSTSEGMSNFKSLWDNNFKK